MWVQGERVKEDECWLLKDEEGGDLGVVAAVGDVVADHGPAHADGGADEDRRKGVPRQLAETSTAASGGRFLSGVRNESAAASTDVRWIGVNINISAVYSLPSFRKRSYFQEKQRNYRV
jgi:hypothetical protein